MSALYRQHISGVLIALSAVCLTVSLLLTAVLFCVYDDSFYQNTYAELHVAEDIGMSAEDLQNATDALLLYCQNDRDDLRVEVEVNGVVRQAFNEREIAHMTDVKRLAQNAQNVRGALFVLFALLLPAGILIGKRRIGRLFQPLLVGFASGMAAVAAVGMYAAVDFDMFWTQFHQVFFTNGLWLLDPSTSILINMVPEAFFFKLVMRILLFFGGAMLLSCGICVSGLCIKRAADKRKG